MSPLLAAIVIPPIIFLLLLVAKNVARLKFCVLCVSISLTWAGLLLVYYLGKWDEPLVIAVLMGETAAGIYHLAEKHARESLQIFRLPFILSLTFLVLVILGVTKGIVLSGAVLLGLWAVFGAAYAYRNKNGVKKIADKIIACCRDW